MGTTFSAMILAAGGGTRMKSSLPKVLHPLCDKPLVYWVADAAIGAGVVDLTTVISPTGDEIFRTVKNGVAETSKLNTYSVTQKVPRGTGDAVKSGLECEEMAGEHVLILNGDAPLIQSNTLRALMEKHLRANATLSFITTRLQEPEGYGRVLRDAAGKVQAIREHKDCTTAELAIDEVNPGFYIASRRFLRSAVANLNNDNAQGEFYVTDLIEIAVREGTVATFESDEDEVIGINTRYQLAIAEKKLRKRLIRKHAENGVRFSDIDQTWVSAEASIGRDAHIGPLVQLRGKCVIGAGARIEAGCVLEDTEVGEGAHLKPYVVATRSVIEMGGKAGPFAHLRPGSHIGKNAQIGNFVEMKNTSLGEGAKAGHLSYLGDGDIGANANIGAGTIFCNYDGVNKHKTTVEKNVFVGSGSQLVAPVTVGSGAYVGTGTTVTKDIPSDALAIGRVRQQNKHEYAKGLRERLKSKK